MPAFLGDFDIRKLYLGGFAIRRAYLGEFLVWSDSKYTLDAGIGRFTLTGEDALPPFNASLGNYKLIRHPVFFSYHRVLEAETGTYVLKGWPANPIAPYIIAAEGVYETQGFAANIFKPLAGTLIAEAGEYHVSGFDAEFKNSIDLEDVIAEYDLTSEGAFFVHARQPVPAELGQYILTPESVGFHRGLFFDADLGEFNLIGNDVGPFVHVRVIPTETGEFELFGTEAKIQYTRVNFETGSFALTGSVTSIARPILANTGEYQLSASDVQFIDGFKFLDGVYNFVGQSISIGWSRVAEPGEFTLSGSDVTFTHHTDAFKTNLVVEYYIQDVNDVVILDTALTVVFAVDGE